MQDYEATLSITSKNRRFQICLTVDVENEIKADMTSSEPRKRQRRRKNKKGPAYRRQLEHRKLLREANPDNVLVDDESLILELESSAMFSLVTLQILVQKMCLVPVPVINPFFLYQAFNSIIAIIKLKLLFLLYKL